VPEFPWPHAPTHQLAEGGTFFVTASTYGKEHYFGERIRLEVLERGLLTVARDFNWRVEAWAVFSNHYHFVAHSPEPPQSPDPAQSPDLAPTPEERNAKSLSQMLGILHTKTARWLNRRDRTPRRKVWYNFRESRLTFQRSYLARLHYTHANAVKHRLVPVANQYPWCSAAWFERVASPAMVASIYRFKLDRIDVPDDFDPRLPD